MDKTGIEESIRSEELTHPVNGHVGKLIEFVPREGSVIFVQLPRRTEFLSAGYKDQAKQAIFEAMPNVVDVVLIGCDVNIAEVYGEDAMEMRLSGLI